MPSTHYFKIMHRPVSHLKLMWTAIALLAAASVFALYSVQNTQHHQNDALRSIICHAEQVVRRTPVSPRFTLTQKRQAIHFYVSSLRDAHIASCDS